jgi:DNA polymerase-3 subunit gamma/tau
LGEITRHLNNICKSEGIEADAEAINTIARQSTGGMRDAISLLDQLASTGGRITLELAQTVLGTATSQSVLALIQAVIDRQPGAGLDEIHHALDGGADARALARQIVDYLRNLMLIQMGNGEQVEVPNDTRAQMVKHAAAIPIADVLRMMRAFNAAAIDQRGGWSPSLGLELAFAEILELPAQAEAVAAPRAVSKPVAVAQPEQHHHAQPASGQSAAAPQSQGQPAGNAAAGVSVTLEQVTKAWRQVSHLVKTKDTNVAALLNSGKLLEIRDGILILSFASDILQEKFNRPESLDLTRKAIHEALGVDLPIQAVVSGNKNALPAHVKPDGMVAAASQLGGEIVDIQ